MNCKVNIDGIHCGVACPNLQPFDKEKGTAKCAVTGNDLMWHDFWIAECDAGKEWRAMKDVDEVRKFLSDCVAMGNQTFYAKPPQPAFDEWWNQHGTKSKREKVIAKKAWYAAVRSLDC